MTDNQPATAKPDWFWEERTYRAANGRVVTERIGHGAVPAKFARFVSEGQVSACDDQGRPIAQRRFTFDLDAETPAEAMAIVLDELKRRIPAQQKILMDEVHQAMGPKIITPNGRLS